MAEKMNPAVKAKWVAALRSGKYTKGTGRLCRIEENGTRTYCCLGVLCEVLGIKGKDLNATRVYGPEEDQNYLPLSVQQQVGLSDPNPKIHVTPFGSTTLADYNDGTTEGLDKMPTFEDIAKVIEEQL